MNEGQGGVRMHHGALPHPPRNYEPLSVLILAGGRSRRMGRDKVWLDLDGQPLVERVARRVLPLADEVIFSTRTPDRFVALQNALGVPAQIVEDQYPGAGPLAGIHAGLKVARHDLLLALAADMPFVSLPLLTYLRNLAAGYDIVAPQIPRRDTGELAWEPLHALYRRTCLPAIERRLSAGDRVVFGFFPDAHTRVALPDEIQRFDPDFLSFFNINTPEDWERGQLA